MAWDPRSATHATYNLILPNDVAVKAELRLETEANIYLLERKYAAVSYTFNRLSTYHLSISDRQQEGVIIQNALYNSSCSINNTLLKTL